MPSRQFWIGRQFVCFFFRSARTSGSCPPPARKFVFRIWEVKCKICFRICVKFIGSLAMKSLNPNGVYQNNFCFWSRLVFAINYLLQGPCASRKIHRSEISDNFQLFLPTQNHRLFTNTISTLLFTKTQFPKKEHHHFIYLLASIKE